MVDILSRLGVDRTFEFIEFLILFFVLVSAVTLISVFINNHRNRTKTRTADVRVEAILRHLGRDLFGEEA